MYEVSHNAICSNATDIKKLKTSFSKEMKIEKASISNATISISKLYKTAGT